MNMPTMGDDEIRIQIKGNGDISEFITTGPNGICETMANNISITPTNVPSEASLELYLNEVWGKQTNVFFEVTLTDHTVNYDLDRDGKFNFGAGGFCFDSTAEEDVLIDKVFDKRKDFNMFYIDNFVKADRAGVTCSNQRMYIEDQDSVGVSEFVSAHELGHGMGIPQALHSLDVKDLMIGAIPDPIPCHVRKLDWSIVNPVTP